jgi:excinuclease ABC subunit B
LQVIFLRGRFARSALGVEIMPANERVIYRVDLMGGKISKIEEIDHITRVISKQHDAIFIFPAKHYVTPKDVQDAALADIEIELAEQLKKFDKAGKILEAERSSAARGRTLR